MSREDYRHCDRCDPTFSCWAWPAIGMSSEPKCRALASTTPLMQEHAITKGQLRKAIVRLELARDTLTLQDKPLTIADGQILGHINTALGILQAVQDRKPL